MTFPALELTITPSTSAFHFHGSADISWSNPFGADAHFKCKVDLSLERQGSSSGVEKPVTCDIHIQGASQIKINGDELDATIDVKGKITSDAPLQLTVDGTLVIPMEGGENAVVRTQICDRQGFAANHRELAGSETCGRQRPAEFREIGFRTGGGHKQRARRIDSDPQEAKV